MKKLYEKPCSDEFGNFVRYVLGLMQVEYLSVQATEKDEDLSLTGSFPVLELDDGQTRLSESLSIARYLSQDKLGFYGPDKASKAQVDQWLDIINLRVAPHAQNLVQQVCGF